VKPDAGFEIAMEKSLTDSLDRWIARQRRGIPGKERPGVMGSCAVITRTSLAGAIVFREAMAEAPPADVDASAYTRWAVAGDEPTAVASDNGGQCWRTDSARQ
jgi:hypothetical protein